MKSITLPIVTLICCFTLTSPHVVQAYFFTPFLEDVAEGETGTKRGWLVAFNPKGGLESFIVLVMSDTVELVAMEAHAPPGVVTDAMLGKPVLITATVLKKAHDLSPEWTRVQLEILKVELLEDDD